MYFMAVTRSKSVVVHDELSPPRGADTVRASQHRSLQWVRDRFDSPSTCLMPPKGPVMTDAKAPCSPGRIFVLLRLLSGGPCGARSERGRSAESGQRPDSVPAETRRDASNAGSLSIRGGLQRLQQLAAARLQYWPRADFGKISTLTAHDVLIGIGKNQ